VAVADPVRGSCARPCTSTPSTPPARPNPGSAAAQILDWAQQASLPVGCLSDPVVLRTALEALTFRLDGSRAAANTIIHKRTILHSALGYAAEGGLLPDNPLDSFGWRVPQSLTALDRQPCQLRAARAQAPAGRGDPDGPGPPVLIALLRAHVNAYGTAPDGRLFQGTRGGPLGESVYGRAWHAARTLALGPELAASGLARRPCGLRHAALSLWLNAGGDPAQIAARAGNSVAVLLTVYTHCVHGHGDLLNQQIGRVLGSPEGRGPCPSVKKPAVYRLRDSAERPAVAATR
jgi:hypothetical protein